MLQIACKNFVKLDRPHCKRTNAAPASRFWVFQQMGIKWISGENRDNFFHLVEIWIDLFLENSYLVSIVSLGTGRHVYLAMVVGNDKSNNGKTLRSSCYK